MTIKALPESIFPYDCVLRATIKQVATTFFEAEAEESGAIISERDRQQLEELSTLAAQGLEQLKVWFFNDGPLSARSVGPRILEYANGTAPETDFPELFETKVDEDPQ